MVNNKKFSKDRLEKSRRIFLEPRISISLDIAMKSLSEGQMTQFLQSTMLIDRDIEHHIMNNCAQAENEEIRIDCVKKAENIKIRILNKLSETLVDKCGGQMEYLDKENNEK